MYVKKISGLEDKKQVVLSRQTLHDYDIIPRRVLLNFGIKRAEVEVDFSADLPEDTVGLSEELVKQLQIPLALPYEMSLCGRNLCIGPVIALLGVSSKTSLTPETLDKFKNYYADYQNIKGLFYICAGNGINVKNKTIEGYYLNPQPQEGEDPWQYGVFPYPNVMYRKSGLKKSVYEDLVQDLGEKIFNGYFFDKWELWDYLSSYPQLREHLPYTEKLTDLKRLNEMLKLHGSIYLKKVFGFKAKGIMKVKKSHKGYHFIYRLKDEKIIKNEEQVAEFLDEINVKKDYIMQQAIPVKKYEQRNFDFRVILQKNKNKQWICSGIIARFGKKESIATNFLLSGYALTGHESLKKVFKMSEREAFLKEEEIIKICVEACTVLDGCAGHYGDVGIDVMIDKDLKIWILEINKLHDHKFPLYALDDAQMYYKVVTTPLEYAKSLAGF